MLEKNRVSGIAPSSPHGAVDRLREQLVRDIDGCSSADCEYTIANELDTAELASQRARTSRRRNVDREIRWSTFRDKREVGDCR